MHVLYLTIHTLHSNISWVMYVLYLTIHTLHSNISWVMYVLYLTIHTPTVILAQSCMYCI